MPLQPGAHGQVPYFFLSYAHIPMHDPNSRKDPNKWVAKLFADLCDHIINMTNLSQGQAGFMDVELRSGHHWPDRLSDALSTCRVFVPLYSARYFESEQCGKEWAAFLQRVRNHEGPDGQMPEAIVPALWTPLPPDHLPQVARSIQFTHHDLGERYGEEGFYGLAKLAGMRGHYQKATLELAKRIVHVAQRTRVGALDPPPRYDELRSVFHDYSPQRPLRVTVVAPDLDHLPSERSPYFYGQTPQEWNPFRRGGNTRTLVSHAEEIATAHGFLPEVGSLEEHTEILASDAPEEQPSVMLVDPWATTTADCRRRLRGFDRRERSRTSVMVPWNLDDRETVAARARLQRSLESALRNNPPDSSPEINSITAFRGALSDALGKAANQLFKTATAYPPAGAPTRRPRLMQPEDPR
ncbi:TIR-like protein FxsC [Microbispora sp. H10830]|uniref:TIR-like protein FxsC n=1 Tax=Microbispora sp. H10830 TaxID=2729109 RepID=UPI002175DCA5|nr:TIR-like protein FxsC [Microbispora sp. H10830]